MKLNPNEYEKEDQNIKRLFDNVSTIIINISRALSQMEGYYSTELEETEKMELRGEIFSFNVQCFQFYMVIEFCKLFEKSKLLSTEGDSSLRNLNHRLNLKYKARFEKSEENLKLISKIEKNVFYKHLLILRNKTYAHSDNHIVNKPMKFVFFRPQQLTAYKSLLLEAIEIYKNCLGLYGIGANFHNFYDSSSTKVFLSHYFRMKKLWKEQHNFR